MDRPIQVGEVLRLSLFIIVVSLALSFVLAFRLLPMPFAIRLGEPAPQTIKSPDRVSFPSQLKTQDKRGEAAAAVADRFVYHLEVLEQQRAVLSDTLQQVTAIRQAEDLSPVDRLSRIAAVSGLTSTMPNLILRLSNEQWNAVITDSLSLLTEALSERITPEQLDSTSQRITRRASPGTSQAQLAAMLAAGALAPNLLFDEAVTQQARRAAEDAVGPVLVAVEKGETIVRDGEVVTPLHLEKLAAVGLLEPTVRVETIAALVLLSLLMTLLLAVYLWLFQPTVLTNPRRLALLAVVMVATVLAAKLTVPDRELYAYVFPAAAAPMLVATLLDTQLAIVVGVLLAPLLSYVAGSSLEMTIYYLAGGIVGALGVWRAPHLNRFALAGVMVTAANWVVILLFWWLTPDGEIGRLGMLGVVGAVNGGLAAALTVGTFTTLGYLFGITTVVHLMELMRPNHPLLRRLLLDAPGTYNHSLVVGLLAERAAEMIDADSLLVRVGAYYHDVGKVLRPGYYAENQLTGDNPHDSMEPAASARIVASHVSEGLELAAAHRLPMKVRDFIAQHHGTRPVSFFYQQAVERGDDPDPTPFHYPGPRPGSKETAIVMLADSVEAIVQASADKSAAEIDRLVEEVVTQRLAEGQLEECNLTFKDLYSIREAFKAVLKSRYNPRLEYPEGPARPPTQRR